MTPDTQKYNLKGEGNSGKILLITGIAGIILCVPAYFVDSEYFLHSYLTSFAFWVTLGLGALFFTMLHHLVNATWSIVLRRISENLMVTLPLLFLFFIPILLFIGKLYYWSDTYIVVHDSLLEKKSPFLNTGFFIFRSIVYFIVWSFFSLVLYRNSTLQDSDFQEYRVKRMKAYSAGGMVLFALTITFASFDWIMSLDAHWYSTIFGVYIYSGSYLAVLALFVLIAQYLRKRGNLSDVINIAHYHDLGRLLFAFIIFWAYIAFSQYFLIWYANIPEETVWYLHRWEGQWKFYSLLLVFGQFIIPFLLLMLRACKRNLLMLKIISVWLMLMHWADMRWLIMPNIHESHIYMSWIDIVSMMAIGGMFLGFFLKRLKSHPLVPVSDPRLEASINISNH